MAETQKSNLTDEQKAAIEHHIKQKAKEIESNFVLVGALFPKDAKNNSQYSQWRANLSEWEKDKRTELSNLPTDELEKLVKGHEREKTKNAANCEVGQQHHACPPPITKKIER